jgi:hypothetical protein
MQPRTRSLVARGLSLVLALSALGSLAGGGTLLLERRGLIVLRRVPEIKVWRWHEASNSQTIAFLNTDVVGGAFVLCPKWVSDANGTSQHFWIPSRSLVMRSIPSGWHGYAFGHVRHDFGNDRWDRIFFVDKKPPTLVRRTAPGVEPPELAQGIDHIVLDPDVTVVDERDPPEGGK